MRFLPHTAEERKTMLNDIGAKSVDDLYNNVAEESVLNVKMDLPNTQSEFAVERHISKMVSKNKPANDHPFFLGAGCYYHHVPSTVDHMIQRSEFLTAYTPYQPEISQGTLATIFQFQSMIAALTGQEVANASMYDGATSLAEAALMARRITKRDAVYIAGELHPDYRDTLTTYTSTIGGIIKHGTDMNDDAACLIVQVPDFYGNIHSLDEYRAMCDKVGAKLIVAVTEIVSLGMLPAPEQADIVVGEGQSIGVPMQFGGPHVGFFACSLKDVRSMPGRLCGVTTDADGMRSFVLTLNTREQHIRRAKATSNICTNVGLCATAFTVHLSLLGEIGFKQLATLNHEAAITFANKLEAAGGRVINETFFNEFVVELPANAKTIANHMTENGIIAGLALEGNKMLVAVTEMTTESDMDAFVTAMKGAA